MISYRPGIGVARTSSGRVPGIVLAMMTRGSLALAEGGRALALAPAFAFAAPVHALAPAPASVARETASVGCEFVLVLMPAGACSPAPACAPSRNANPKAAQAAAARRARGDFMSRLAKGGLRRSTHRAG